MHPRLAFNCIALIALVSSTAFAQVPPRPTIPQPTMPPRGAHQQKGGFTGNPQALQILKNLEQAIDHQPAAYMEIVSTKTLTSPGSAPKVTAKSGKIWQKQPAQLVWIPDDPQTWTVVSDGKQLCMYLPSDRIYTLQPASRQTIDKELVPLNDRFGVVMTHLLGPTMRGNAAVPVVLTRGEDLGQEDMNGQSLHHVRIGIGLAILDCWLNDQQLPVRIMETQQFGVTMSTVLTTVKWVTGQPIADSTFAISLPADARSVNVLYGLPSLQPGNASTTGTQSRQAK